MPLLAAAAVMLCSAMVLITWSIMGGFLVKFLEVGSKMEGDVSISWPVAGFPYYEDLIQRLEADPIVAAAAPTIESFGLIGLPDNRLQPVKIRGVDPRYARVAEYADSLWWKPIQEPLPKDKSRLDPRLDAQAHRKYERAYDDGLALKKVNPDTGRLEPAVVLGIEVAGFSRRLESGAYEIPPGILRREGAGGDRPFSGLDPFIVNHSVVINVLPLTAEGRDIKVASRKLPVANEFRTGVFNVDKEVVLMDLSELQRMLKLDQGESLSREPVSPYDVDSAEPRRESVGVAPARVTNVLIKGKPGVDIQKLRDRAEEIYARFSLEYGAAVPSVDALSRARSIATWEQNYAMFIGAVKKEIAMVLGLLMFISFVAVFLVLAIFWAMVSEKTKDIGVLRAVGASRAGVAWLWLRYGLSLGVVGTLLGVAASYAIVWNINPIHEWLGTAFGVQVWDPRIYYFTELPNQVVTYKALVVAGGGLLFSVVGALIPALRAALYDPVKALRFE